MGAVKGREGRGLTAAMVEQVRRSLGGPLRSLCGALRSKLCRTNKTLRRPVLHEPATRDPGTGVDDEPQARVVVQSFPRRVAGRGGPSRPGRRVGMQPRLRQGFALRRGIGREVLTDRAWHRMLAQNVAGIRITRSLTPMRFDAQPFKIPPVIADRQYHATRLRIGLEGKGSDLSAL